MLLIIRLTKSTTSAIKYTLPKEIKFSKLTFKGYSFERVDNLAADSLGLAPATNSELPVYMSCDFINDNDVLFFQGKNNTIRTAGGGINIDNMIPLGGVREGQTDEGNYSVMDLKLIDRQQTWEVGKEISITLFQIQKNVATPLTNNQAFGSINDDGSSDPAIPGSGPSPYDHGCNLYFEFQNNEGHDFTQSYNVADGEPIS